MITPEKLILGCGNFGGVGSLPELFGKGETEAEARVLLKSALESGLRSFDTAHSYGGGGSESILGRFLQTLPPARRGELHVATKIGNPLGTAPGRAPLEASEVERQLGISLLRLKLDSVDLLYLHEPDPSTPLCDTLPALEIALERGRFRNLGLSNVNLSYVQNFLAAASPRLRACMRFVQNEFHYLQREDLATLIPFLRARGISYCAFSPLAGGLLSGKYRRQEEPPAGSRVALRPQPYLKYLGEESFALIDELALEAARHKETLPQAALRFALSAGHADFAVIGPRRETHLLSLLGQPAASSATNAAHREALIATV